MRAAPTAAVPRSRRWPAAAATASLVTAAIAALAIGAATLTGYRVVAERPSDGGPVAGLVVTKLTRPAEVGRGDEVTFESPRGEHALLTQAIRDRRRAPGRFLFATRAEGGSQATYWGVAANGTLGTLVARLPGSRLPASAFAGHGGLLLVLFGGAAVLALVLRRRRGWAALAAAALLIAGVSAGVGPTLSAFSSQTSNAGNAFTGATDFCVTPGSQTLIASADAWVLQDSPSNNNGGDSALYVLSKSGSQNRRVFVNFTLPSRRNWCDVASASLRVYAESAATGRTLQAYRTAASWTEMGVTWSNQPATTGTAATTASGTGWRSFDVTSQVREIYHDGATSHGWVVRDSVENSASADEQKFRERSSSTDEPELVITWD
jgi:hypothetical protein